MQIFVQRYLNITTFGKVILNVTLLSSIFDIQIIIYNPQFTLHSMSYVIYYDILIEE